MLEIEVAPDTNPLECPACEYQYRIWGKIIERTGDATYGYRAFAALGLEQAIKDFPELMKEITLDEFADLQSVRIIMRQFEEHQRWEANQPKANS